MGRIKTPIRRSVVLATWFLAGLLVLNASFSPDPAARALLLTILSALTFFMWVREKRLARSLRADAKELALHLEMLEKAENLADYGRWCIQFEPRRHLWSQGMARLLSLPPESEPSEANLDRVMPGGIAQIETVLEAHAADREPFTIEFEIEEAEHKLRMLRARVHNSFSPEGKREQAFLVIRDVTNAYALRRDRDEAVAQLEDAKKDANTDALTGLPNRRFAMGELDRNVVSVRNQGGQLSIVVFDIDHFKSVNDRHGHPVGDKVIAKVGAIAAQHIRENDLIARIGGEEFIWIMPGCTADAALRAAERLCWAVEAGTHSAPIPSITISAGYAELAQGDASLTLFARADAALYEAKRAGRNRVTRAA